MKALRLYMPRKRVIVGIFLLWLILFATLDAKKQAREYNLSRCVNIALYSSISFENTKRNLTFLPQDLGSYKYKLGPSKYELEPMSDTQIQSVSKTYNVTPERVEHFIRAEERKVSHRRRVRQSYLNFERSSIVPLIRLDASESVQKKQNVLKEKLSKRFAAIVRGIRSVMRKAIKPYKKITGISFSKKTCEKAINHAL